MRSSALPICRGCSGLSAAGSFLVLRGVLIHAVLDVVVDGEVQLLNCSDE
jgi:hypothetical protein